MYLNDVICYLRRRGAQISSKSLLPPAGLSRRNDFSTACSIISGRSRDYTRTLRSDGWRARQPSLRPTLFLSLPPLLSLSHTRARFPFPPPPPPCVTPPCHGRCRLNNYPHGVLNSSLATWNPSTEFARPRCGTLRLDRAGALRGELLINTSGGRGRERDGLRSGSANFAAVIIQSGARHPQKGSTIKGWRIPRRSLLLLLLDITIKFRSCERKILLERVESNLALERGSRWTTTEGKNN